MATDLRVTVSGSDAGLSRVLNQVERSTRSAERAMAQYDKSTHDAWAAMAAAEKQLERDTQGILDRKHDAYTRVGQASMVMGALVAAGLGMATKAAMDWETAWTGVMKTVDGSDAEMAALESELRNLATTLPVTHAEIAGVAEAAGQLGVAREDIAGFTRTVLDLSVSTNLTADQAATDMARFTNIMGTPTAEVDRLGASLVALGNNGASTESEILALGLRMAAAGKLAGMTEAEVLGLSNAMTSVGIEAEAGGTAVTQTVTNITQAVEGGGEKLEAFAQLAGMSSEAFAAAWEDDAAGALNAVLRGLNAVDESGGSVFGTLDKLGIAGIRQRDTLLRLAGAGDLLSDSLDLGNRAWAENLALQEEADRFYGTSANRLKVVGNQVRDLAIDFGADLLPVLVTVGQTFSDLIAFVSDMPGPLRGTILVLAGLAAAVGLFGGAALIAIPKISAFKVAVAGLEAGAMRTAGTRLMGLGSFLMGPWGIALAAATVGLGVFAAKQGAAAREVEALKATLDEQTGALTDNSVSWATSELSKSGAFEAAKELGINLGTVTQAALGSTEAMAELRDAVWEAREAGDAGVATKLMGEVSGLKLLVDDGVTSWQLDAEAKREAGDAADIAADAQDGLTGAWGEGAAEAGDLTEQVDALKETFDALSGAFLDEREASRAVRDSLREVREAVKAYREEHGNLDGAFKAGTESGDRFGGMLDDLAKDYQNKIAATYAATGSEHAAMKAYESSRRSLIRVAEQLGMTRDEARAYADQVLGVPTDITTNFTANTEPARTALDSFIRTASGRTITIGTRIVASSAGIPGGMVARADGGLLDFYANGGVRENHVAQIAPAGAWRVWAEPETGGEAYIPLSPAKRGRSIDIWEQVGERLGVRFASFASGGINAGGAGGSSSALIAQFIKALLEATQAQQAVARERRATVAARTRHRRYERAVERRDDARSNLADARQNKASRLDLLTGQQRVRDLRRSLRAGGDNRLSGLDRSIAQAQLGEARRELDRMEKSAKAVERARIRLTRVQRELNRSFGTGAQEAKRLEKAEEALAAAQEARANVQDRVADIMDVDLVGSGSPAASSRRLSRLLSDVSDFNVTYAALASAGASPWLLGQLAEAARSGDYAGAVRFGRRLLADRSLFTQLEGQGRALSALGTQQGELLHGVIRPNAVPAAQMAGVVTPAGSSVSITNNFTITSDQVQAVATEVLRHLAHEGLG